MSNVISLAAVRAERTRQALLIHARDGKPTIIETRSGTIVAQKLTCREPFAEIHDSFGDYSVVDYADIRSIRPAVVAQTSVVNAHGEFLPAPTALSAPASVAILPFARRARRK
jgi:hypothetical protein